MSGQTGEAFVTSLNHAKPVAFGLNCALGAEQMKPFVQNISRFTDAHIICYPNAVIEKKKREKGNMYKVYSDYCLLCLGFTKCDG